LYVGERLREALAGTDDRLQGRPLAAGAVQVGGLDQVGARFQEVEALGDRVVERGQERQLAGVVAERRVQLDRRGGVVRVVRLDVLADLDELPERHGEAVALDRFARDERTRRDHRETAVGQPADDGQLAALAAVLGGEVGLERRRQDRGHPDDHRRGREVHDDGEHVVQDLRVRHLKTEVAACPDGRREGAGGAGGQLFGRRDSGHIAHPAIGSEPDASQ